MRRLVALIVAGAAIVSMVGVACGAFSADPRSAGTRVPAGGTLPLAAEEDPADPPDLNPPPVALAPPGGAIIQQGLVRIPKPKVDLNGQRRVGIQIGHWQTEDVPKEYGTRIQAQTGTSWAGVTEVDTTTVIANKMAVLLKAQGIAVDILPTTVPEGYIADVFIALHCDGDGVGELSGFKMAIGSRRSTFDARLMQDIKDVYAKATGLSYDQLHVSRGMTSYYPFNWSRYQHAASPFTPATIIELGFLSNDDDRALLTGQPDTVATALVNGIFRFLDDTPRSKIFGDDLLLAQTPLRPGVTATPTTPP